MNVDELDRYPGLELERVYLAAAVKAGVAVLGVCLGHQLLARALGAEVTLAGGREFGFSPVSLTDDGGHSPLAAIRGVPGLQWHGDVAGLPAGARRLAGTAVCPNQAFALGSALGLQFHVEVGEAVFAQWMGAGLLEEDLRRAGAPDVAAQARALYPGVEEAYREVVRGWIRGVSHGG
jgi:GMP synthase (glutamine-hydrolysing)